MMVAQHFRKKNIAGCVCFLQCKQLSYSERILFEMKCVEFNRFRVMWSKCKTMQSRGDLIYEAKRIQAFQICSMICNCCKYVEKYCFCNIKKLLLDEFICDTDTCCFFVNNVFFYIWKKEQGKTIKKILFFILLYSQLVTFDNNHIIHVLLFFFIFITLKNFTEDSSQMLDQMQIFVRNGFLLQNNSAKLIHQHYHLHCDLYLSDSKICQGHFRF